MTLNDLKTLIKVFLHILVINQMLFELLGQLGTENLKIFDLLWYFLSDFDNLFINISTKEMSSLGWVLSSILHVFQDFENGCFLLLLNRSYFIHYIFKQILDQ